MGLLGLLGKKQRVQFIYNNNTVIQFDASLKESHTRESPATENPIENGDDISDHIIVKPFKLELTGVISDTPLDDINTLLTEVSTTVISSLVPPVGVIGAAAGLALFRAIKKSKSPSVQAYGQLLKLQASGQTFDVLTTLHRYENMAISSLSVPREAATANCLEFSISLSQLLIVSPQSVNIQVFANPALAANDADTGQHGAEYASRFKQGVKDATEAAKGYGYDDIPGGH